VYSLIRLQSARSIYLYVYLQGRLQCTVVRQGPSRCAAHHLQDGVGAGAVGAAIHLQPERSFHRCLQVGNQHVSSVLVRRTSEQRLQHAGPEVTSIPSPCTTTPPRFSHRLRLHKSRLLIHSLPGCTIQPLSMTTDRQQRCLSIIHGALPCPVLTSLILPRPTNEAVVPGKKTIPPLPALTCPHLFRAHQRSRDGEVSLAVQLAPSLPH
jgi:hypothetical protein